MTIILFEITGENLSVVKSFTTNQALIEYGASIHGLEFDPSKTMDSFKERIVVEWASFGTDCRCLFFDSSNEARVFAWVYQLCFPSSDLLKTFISEMHEVDGQPARCKVSEIRAFVECYRGLYADLLKSRWFEIFPMEKGK